MKNDNDDDESVPMLRGKAMLERLQQQTPASNNAGTLDANVFSLTVKKIESILFDACPHVAQTRLSAWRKQYIATHTDVTLGQLLVDARREHATTTVLGKRKTRPVQNADELNQLLEQGEKNQRSKAFEDELECILPLAALATATSCTSTATTSTSTASTAVAVAGRECKVCFEFFEAEATLHCVKSESDTICRKCFVHYCREKMNTETPESLPCVICKAGYDRCVMQVNLPPDVFDKMQQLGVALDQRVALASDVKAVLYCQCGTVAVIEAKDVGNGIVSCVCKAEYCIKCGNFSHIGQLCPPPRETIRWLDKHGKRCPNCGEGIQKDGGCQHMTCRSCRFEFCWHCMARWKGSCRH